MDKTIYLCLAHMSEEGIEQKYVKEAFDTNWVVPLGPNVNAFENDLKKFVGGKNEIVVLSAGTAAVHLALIGCGVVHPTSNVPGKTSPVEIINAPRPIETIGLKINGITRIGFNTIGAPNRIGSLIPNNAGINDNLPTCFKALFLLIKHQNTQPIVTPLPVKLPNADSGPGA